MISDTLTLAKQLGALVFTFKGQDVPDTILRFAKEYRVGHIVIGSPTPRPLWQKILGKGSAVERLIHEAKGITLVIIDTSKEETFPLKEELFEEEKIEPRLPAPEEQLLLSRLLSPRRIVIWDQPVDKDKVLHALVEAAVADGGMGNFESVLNAVLKREEQGSTFMNEGVAFPHARLDQLEASVVALGLTRWGIADVETEKPIALVFLILSPAKNPETQIQVLGLISKAAMNRPLTQDLQQGQTPEQILETIRNWEMFQKPASSQSLH
jgi:two-component system sensor histidine kinase KdpD